MADDASQKRDLSDKALLTYFNRTYPQGWMKCNKESPTNAARPQLNIDQFGKNHVVNLPIILCCAGAPTPYPSYMSSCAESKMANSCLPATRSQLDMQKTSYVLWAKRFPHWDHGSPQTPMYRKYGLPAGTTGTCLQKAGQSHPQKLPIFKEVLHKVMRLAQLPII
jgi:hypothetical protein